MHSIFGKTGETRDAMVKAQDKVNATEFSVETGLDEREIRQAGQVAIEAGKRFMTSTISEAGVSANRIDYVIKGPGGIMQQMAFRVGWEQTPSGRRRVQMKVGEYMTTRQTVLFVPVTPKSVTALVSVKRFAEALQRELIVR